MAKIGILVALKLVIYFWFVSETIGVKPATFHSRTQNFVKSIALKRLHS